MASVRTGRSVFISACLYGPARPSVLSCTLSHGHPRGNGTAPGQVIDHKQGTKGKIILTVRDDGGKTEL